MTIPNGPVRFRNERGGETVLTRMAGSSLSSGADLSPAQIRMDRFVGQSLNTISDPRTAALALIGGGLIARLAGSALLSRIFVGARGAAAAQTAAPSWGGLFSEMGLVGLRGAPAFRWAPAATALLGSSVLVAGCASEEMIEPTPDARSISAVGDEFQINVDRNTGTNQGMAMALNGSGNLVVAWADYNTSDPNQHGVFARAFDAAGPSTAVVAADRPMGSVDVLPSVSTNSRGNFVVSWTNQSGPGSPSRVLARRFDNEGRLIGGTIPVLSSGDPATQPLSSIVLLEDGGFVLVANDNSATCGACAHFYNADNTPASESALIPSGSTVSAIHVGTGTQGNWTWAAMVPGTGGNSEIQFQSYRGRTPQGSLVRHSIGNIGTAAAVRAASLPNGSTMLAWQTSAGIMAQVLGDDGTELSEPFQVAALTPGGSFSLASDERGSFVIAWENEGRILASAFNGMGEPLPFFTNQDVAGSSGQNSQVALTANGAGRVSIAWRRFSTSGGAHQDLIARNYQIAYE